MLRAWCIRLDEADSKSDSRYKYADQRGAPPGIITRSGPVESAEDLRPLRQRRNPRRTLEGAERDKFDRYSDREARRLFALLIRSKVHLFVVRDTDLAAVDPPCRDAKDNQFLGLALVAEADVLVSSDEDLLVLHPWRGMPILTAAQFLA